MSASVLEMAAIIIMVHLFTSRLPTGWKPCLAPGTAMHPRRWLPAVNPRVGVSAGGPRGGVIPGPGPAALVPRLVVTVAGGHVIGGGPPLLLPGPRSCRLLPRTLLCVWC